MADPGTMIFVGEGSSFRCECGCNVFIRTNAGPPARYRCNACGTTYEAVVTRG